MAYKVTYSLNPSIRIRSIPTIEKQNWFDLRTLEKSQSLNTDQVNSNSSSEIDYGLVNLSQSLNTDQVNSNLKDGSHEAIHRHLEVSIPQYGSGQFQQ
jgi:hypothetical protein